MTTYKGNALHNQTPAPRLTKAQAAKVKSLMEDEGETRASAVAWVRAFEASNATSTVPPWPCTMGLGKPVVPLEYTIHSGWSNASHIGSNAAVSASFLALALA